MVAITFYTSALRHDTIAAPKQMSEKRKLRMQMEGKKD